MNAMTRFGIAMVLLIGATITTCADGARAQEKKPYDKHDASALNSSLRDVINTGAKMFNEHGDHAGCYRLFQGSLLSVRPFLSPTLQKKIDDSLLSAEKLPLYSERAFELRKVLDEIRAATKGAVANGKTGDGDKGQVMGRLTFEGKPVAGGYFVTLVGKDGKKFSSAINKDGTFQLKTGLTPGDYRVAIERIPGDTGKVAALPARFAMETTSGLSIRVQAGKQQVDLNLVK